MATSEKKVNRLAQIIRLRPSALEEYKKCHAAVWPEILKEIKECNIEDYSIYYDDLSSTLFASFKYVGDDFEADMAKMKENPKMLEWWAMTDGMQESCIPGAKGSKDGPWWKELEEVFYLA